MRSEHRKEYHKNTLKIVLITSALIIALAILSIYSLSINNFEVSFQEAWGAVKNRLSGYIPRRETDYLGWMIDQVVIEVDAPRTIAAILVGTILAISGAVMQTVTRNPLAEPYTIGISSAALFGVSIALLYGVALLPGQAGMGLNAFLFAMIPAMAIVSISSFKKLSPNMMILVGIGMMYMFSAMTTFMKFNASEEDLQEIYMWSLGTLTETNWGELVPMLAGALLVLVGFMFLAKDLNVLMAGDKVCQSLGVNPVKTRIICFGMVSVSVAIAVCYTGTIGFVGLVAPHIARLFTGNNNRILIPVSAVIGALLIIVSDIIVRSLPGGLPAGVITALIGAPMFLFFLFKQRRKSDF